MRIMNIRICKVEPNTELSKKLLDFVENSSWDETKEHTAKTIRENNSSDWEAMFVEMDGDKIVGHASIAKTDYYPMPEIYPWISTVFVTEEYRGQKISGLLIDYIEKYAKELGFNKKYIPSEHFGIYERYGYNYEKDIENYGGEKDHLFSKKI